MKVLLRERDLSEEYLRFLAQIGADGVDIHHSDQLPGVAERGFLDPTEMEQLVDRLRRWGLGIYRVAPPQPTAFLSGEDGAERDVDHLCRTIEALGKAGIPFMSMPVHHRPNPGYRGYVKQKQRGGSTMAAFDVATMRRSLEADPPDWTPADIQAHYERCVHLYEQLIPVAVASNVRLILHPSDPPLPEAEFSPLRWSSILDAVPSDHSGLLYCIGTRYETGLDIHDDIRAFGRRGKIFHVHFRNVRGTIPNTGGYQEVALHDGDMNMFRVLQTLRSTGYDGALQVDHLPALDGDDGLQASAYGVSYIKALLAALEA
jgi:mannonate dehydratase